MKTFEKLQMSLMMSNFLTQKQMYDRSEQNLRESCERIITQVAVAYRGKDVEMETGTGDARISVASTGEVFVNDKAMESWSTDYLSDVVTTVLQYLSDAISRVLYSKAGDGFGVDKRLDGVRNKDDYDDGAYCMSANAIGFEKLLFAAMSGVRPVADFWDNYDDYEDGFGPTMEETQNLLYLLNSLGVRNNERIVWALYDINLHVRGDFEGLVATEGRNEND